MPQLIAITLRLIGSPQNHTEMGVGFFSIHFEGFNSTIYKGYKGVTGQHNRNDYIFEHLQLN